MFTVYRICLKYCSLFFPQILTVLNNALFCSREWAQLLGMEVLFNLFRLLLPLYYVHYDIFTLNPPSSHVQ